MQRKKLGYDLRKGDAVLNNFELKKISEEEVEVMALLVAWHHTKYLLTIERLFKC